jgi:hypothetical protein
VTAVQTTPDLTAIKATQQQTWSSGNFSVVATRIQLVAEQLAERAQLRLERGAPPRPAALGADPVERPVARRRDDPGRGTVRDAVARPALERGEEGVLHRLLGAVEIAEDVCEGGDRLSGLAPEQAVDEDVPRAGQEALLSVLAACACSAS